MVDLVGIAIIVFMVLCLVLSIRVFGRYFPHIPKLNEWPINAIVIEQRGNIPIPRTELARSIKNKQGDWSFELKKTKIKTPPKKLRDIYSDMEARNFIFLRQLTRDTLAPLKLELEENPDLVRMKIQQEHNTQLERYRQRELVRKHSKSLSMLQIYLPIGMVVIALVGVAIYFTIISEPILEAQAAYQSNTNAMITATNALEKAILVLTGG